MEAISLSLDGADPARHDGLRGVPGCFDRTLAAARRGASAAISDQHPRERGDPRRAAAIHRLADELGAARWSLFFLVAVGRGSAPAPSRPKRASASSSHSWSSPRYRARLTTNRGAPLPARGDRARGQATGRPRPSGRSRRRHPRRQRDHVHLAHRRGAPVGLSPAHGRQYPHRRSVALYRGSGVFRALRRTDLFGGRCGRCEYREPCGGSRARAFAATRDPLAEDPLCRYDPAAPVR